MGVVAQNWWLVIVQKYFIGFSFCARDAEMSSDWKAFLFQASPRTQEK